MRLFLIGVYKGREGGRLRVIVFIVVVVLCFFVRHAGGRGRGRGSHHRGVGGEGARGHGARRGPVWHRRGRGRGHGRHVGHVQVLGRGVRAGEGTGMLVLTFLTRYTSALLFLRHSFCLTALAASPGKTLSQRGHLISVE